MKHFTLYSSEKYHTQGNGSFPVKIDTTLFDNKEDLMKEVNRLRHIQKQSNDDYKLSLKQMRRDQEEVIINPKILSGVTLRLDHKTGNSCVAFGASKTGKTTLMMYLFKKYYNNKNYINTLYAANTQIKLYKKNRNLLIYPGFDNNAIELIKSHKYLNTRCNNKYNFNELFDDIIVTTKYNNTINELCCTLS